MGDGCEIKDAAIVSVVMPMRNAVDYVSEAIQSIIDQEHRNIEIIVVDDGSTDGSIEVVKSIGDDRIHIVNGPCKGISMAFNMGLSVLTGDIVMRCDADDRYPVGRITEQVRWLRQHSKYGAVCGRFSSMDQPGKHIVPVRQSGQAGSIRNEIIGGITRTHYCTFAVRREVLESVGGCREYFKSAEDLDLQFRLAEVCDIWYQPSECYQYRLHQESITHQQKNDERLFYQSTAQQMLSQRLDGGKDDIDAGNPPKLPDFCESPRLAKRAIQGMLMSAAWGHRRTGQWGRSVRLGWSACLQFPSNPGAWWELAALVFKRSDQSNSK
jgi:GT2 family glycosyltransferase